MQVIGHRGAAALAPENTWAGFDMALSIGVDAIETDIRATSDGELILIHDESLDRTTNGSGIVHKTPWSVIKTLDAGSWFSEAYRGAPVPRLRDTLEHYGRHTHLDLEIKQSGVEFEALKMVQDLGLQAAVTFTSFDFTVVQRLKTEAPDIQAGWLMADINQGKVMTAIQAGLNQVCPAAKGLSPDLVSEWRGLGLEVRAWGVSDPDVMMLALNAGVDGMTVDFPQLLLKALGRTP
ncbi:MAG: glycerophosphodiester phosphodiesterase family protein [Leptolyngbyaceae cyanobacterium MO_188.B28]|nr:glycerophosphodiester phosphodiesterase family protein [Leptolyngbyaceae cyanobacterium MO_188.B28]